MTRTSHLSSRPSSAPVGDLVRAATGRVALAPLCTCAIVLALGLVVLPTLAQSPPSGTVRRPLTAGSGTVIVPDHFLRRWDPVTLFFTRDVGGEPGAPEDQPERLVSLSPPHPGSFTWVDRRTLQFRPADPWSPLERFTWQVDGETFTLTTLMAAPVETIPAADAEGLDPVQAVTLTFPEPIDPADLARMVSIALRPLPGLGNERVRWLTRDDFVVKTMERAARADNATYVLNLASPIAMGTRATVQLRLSLDDESASSFTEFSFATAEPFRVVAVGSRRTRFPITPDGSRYTRDQAINAGSDSRTVVVELSAQPRAVSPVEARNLVRFSPAVAKLEYEVLGRTLEVSGDFDWDTVYRVTVAPTPIQDLSGRTLALRGPSEVHLYFPRLPAFLRWQAADGVVERYGPLMVPVEGRGHDRFDLRIFPIDPFDRSFWPFPEQPVAVDESERPPGPGETPEPFSEARHISEYELRDHLSALGSPPVSALVALPLRKEGSSASFGLELADHLRRLAPAGAPGHYLIGLRPLEASSLRQWMRLQVTDLSLTTVEEPHAVRFVVTSLASGQPVSGATVTVEGSESLANESRWVTIGSGTTDAEGAFRWSGRPCYCSVLRLSVRLGDDVLVLDPTRPPDGFSDNTWSESSDTWLQWTTSTTEYRGPQPEEVSHLFTERPVYRPEEPVHIKGYLRTRFAGHFSELPLSHTFVVVEGPGDLEWRYPVELTEVGSFYHRFLEEDRPTGVYTAHLEGARPGGSTYSSRSVSFRIEAYRLPLFEVDLHGPDTTPLDREFEVGLTATYYAGGRVADRPVAWRVTQFPYTWTPSQREGFYFSSDGRFSRTQRFEATAALEKTDRTDDEGSARLVLNPAIEASAQPRTYVVEATVTGADDQTVTATRQVVALPPFVVGLKVPRYLERATALAPELIVLGPDGEPVAGQQLTVRLLHRQWHSYLRASDFSDGEARYVTDVVDEEVFKTTATSAADALSLDLPLTEAGVYVVEVEARDRVGRAQVVAVDLYAGGDEPVTWAKPSSKTFRVTPDKDRYEPGEEARLVLESPFQEARALVIVEAPDGNRYEWLEVHGGNSTYRLLVEPTWAPRLPVHCVLMRGRVTGTEPMPGSTTDLGKPATVAATTWLAVTPRDNTLVVDLDHPERALPGQQIEVTIHLSDPDQRPLPGEVTLWLVDQAVLALGREQRLDPLPDLITDVSTHLEVRDTRHLPFGELPFAENPGGDQAEEGAGLLERATVRRNFQPVPFYDPRILVGDDGVVTVRVQLPDDLTNFKLRAKAVSGAERFGVGAGHLAVRLPVIVQPALPRFVRPGDRFLAAAIGRVVEGEGGPGTAQIRATGVAVEGDSGRVVAWVPNRPERIEFPVSVPTPPYDENGELTVTEALLTIGVERTSDGARDAFEVRLPIRDDRKRVTLRVLEEVAPGSPVALPEVAGEPRPGTVRRTVLVSNQPALVRMAAGLSFLVDYPFGCTEQRLALARAHIAMQKFRDLLFMDASAEVYERAVEGVLEWVPQVVTEDGMVAYWPGSQGYVSLTAWVVQFLAEARDAGFTIDQELMDTLLPALERALRSDYGGFIDGESFAERCWALTALTRAGRFDPAYAAELARQAQFLDLEATAQVLQSFVAANAGAGSTRRELAAKLWDGVVTRLWQGREIYGGLQRLDLERNGLILPSETRALAEVTRALAAAEPDNVKVQVLVNGLVTLGRGDGWGSTNANAAALLALSQVLERPADGQPERRLQLTMDGSTSELKLSAAQPVARRVSTRVGSGSVAALGGDGPPMVVRAETSWIPAADGSTVVAESAGFVVGRELLLVLPGDAPARRLPVDQAALSFALTVGDVVEDHVQVVNPADRNYVAVVVPLAAGMEPLNPNLATAPPEARPSGSLTLAPAYAAYLDDHVAFYFDSLPKGTYDFYFRTRANVPGRFIQPPAWAEMMYDGAVRGHGNGSQVVIAKAPEGD